MAEVSIESLNNIKKALEEFQKDIESDVEKVQKIIDNKKIECYDKLFTLHVRVKDVEDDIKVANDRLRLLKKQFNSCSHLEKSYKKKFDSLDGDLIVVNHEISKIEDNIDFYDDRDTSETNKQLKIRHESLQRERVKIEESMRKVISDIEENNLEKLAAEKNIDITEKHLVEKRKELMYLNTKVERLSNQNRKLNSSIEKYIDSAKKFKKTANDRVNSNKNSIEKCISIIEEYMNINLNDV